MSISISRFQFEHHREALGIGESSPRLSWRFEGDIRDWIQKSYEIEIVSAKQISQIYAVDSSDSVLVPWPGTPLRSGEALSVRVRAFGTAPGQDTDWSRYEVVEAGLLERNDWTCSLINSPIHVDIEKPRQPVLFRRSFVQETAVSTARFYITAHGVYEAQLNGKPIGDHVLAPGWTSYKHRLPYQTFDVTDLLVIGENVIAAEVAEGWFCGRLGFFGGKRNVWGTTVGLMAKLVITSENDEVHVLNTDSAWKSSTGSLVTSELYDGEVCDLGLEPTGWSLPGFDDSSWTVVETQPLPAAQLVAPDGPPVRKIESLKPTSILKTPSGKLVVDFGQNIVGWVRLRLSGPKGRVITLLHTEVLENGEVATRPLRLCKATDSITLSGEDQFWEPKFTFHGFRYVQIDGYSNEEALDLSNITAVVIHTDMEQTGWFDCSHALINKLHCNIRWGMRGNFLSIPTDCPQRDERLGWTGDIHLFAPTANYLYDTSGMLRSWARDLVAEQMCDGSGVPSHFCPNVFFDEPKVPTAIWGDVIVGLPWDLFKSYGDSQILSQHLESMQAWMHKGIVRDRATGLWDEHTFQFGDWLDPKAPPENPGDSVTDPFLVANAYLVHVTSLMQQICTVLDLTTEAATYGASVSKLKTAYQQLYITPSGRVVSDSQTALALSIHFELFPTPAQLSSAVSRLRTLILRHSRFKIATGFAGTPLIGHALSRVGLGQVFYRMLYHRKAPSWLYQVTMGATTMWERWDSILPDGSVNPGEMTSFNHYALGAVADWMHSYIAGLVCVKPGWRHFRVAPVPGGDLKFANARFLSPYGMISVGWVIEDEFLRLQVEVPPNATAEVVLPSETQTPVLVRSGIHKFKIECKLPDWPLLPDYPQFCPHDDDEP